MKKKNIIMITVLLVVSFYLGGKFNNNKTPNITSHNNSLIAMYIQDEEGNYNLSDAQEFPKDGYILNTQKSACKNGGIITQNPNTKALSLKVKTSDECSVYFDIITFTNPSADMLLAKANDVSITNYASGNKKEMYAFDHPETSQTTGWSEEERRDYRYIGNEPNNYITFNDETWRILGIFTVETESGAKEQLIKIIRNEAIGNLEWNSFIDDSNPYGQNEWSTATLQTLLNEEYYNQIGDFTNTSSTVGLNTINHSKIAKVKWYLGGVNNSNAPDYYHYERGIKTCATEGNCNNQIRTTNIIQNIGLMYASDYLYTYANGIDDNCFNKGESYCERYQNENSKKSWLLINYYEWTLTPKLYSNNLVIFINALSYGYGYVYSKNAVRPALYLAANTKIISGTGASDDPYILSQS